MAEGDDQGAGFRLIPTALASSTAASLARIPVHPIDSVKSILQASPTPTTVREVVRRRPLSSLYRGLGVAFVGSIPAGALYFTTYEVTKRALHGRPETLAHFAAGMTAEAISCVLWLPVDVVKERRQVQVDRDLYRSDFDALRRIYQSPGGIRALYRGYFATLFSFGPFTGVYFAVYEALKKRVGGAPGDLITLAMGAISGATAAFVTTPLDLTKLRLQVQSRSHDFQYRGFWSGLRSVAASGGVAGMFRGAGARIAFHVPSAALSITLYESFKRRMHSVL